MAVIGREAVRAYKRSQTGWLISLCLLHNGDDQVFASVGRGRMVGRNGHPELRGYPPEVGGHFIFSYKHILCCIL